MAPTSVKRLRNAVLSIVVAVPIAPFAVAEVSTSAQCKLEPGTTCHGLNLAGADLRGKRVYLGDFSAANLEGANLEGLNLWRADLSGSNLAHANMRGAFFVGADLRGAVLRGADLREAFLFRAFTEGADFSGAALDGARWMTGAICGPGSIGECKPLPPTADYAPPPMLWHLQKE